MPLGVEREWDVQLGRNADHLEQALDRRRRTVDVEFDDPDERLRHAQAVEHIAQYVALLREAAGTPVRAGRLYWFKLVWPDGRWAVAEKALTEPPRVGDRIDFDDGSAWRVGDSQLVWPRPARKPQREFFVCAPTG